jgi:DNA-binding transcriptional LysR family regulator
VSSGQDLATWHLTGPNGSEEVRVTGRFSANSARSLLKSCVSGLGIALLPDMMVVEDLSTGRLTQVLPNYRSGGAKFSVILPSREQIPAAVSTFVEFATAKLEALLANQAPKPARKRGAFPGGV